MIIKVRSKGILPLGATRYTLYAIRYALCAFVLILLPSALYAASAVMGDYCAVPPYVRITAVPNLLLMIDNSASQYDLQYQDTTNTYCANNPTTSCTPGTTCSGAAYCLQSLATTISGATW